MGPWDDAAIPPPRVLAWIIRWVLEFEAREQRAPTPVELRAALLDPVPPPNDGAKVA